MPTIAGVEITHPDRVLYPEQGITKRQLAEFYETIADWILPFVSGRPLSIVRCPEGAEKACFYQKHVGAEFPASIRRVSVREDSGARKEYPVVDGADGLVALVQMGTLELHPWGSHAKKIERPDMVTFDLDPGPGVAWTAVLAAARRVRAALEALELESFVKTTGGKGLHVVFPIAPTCTWDEAKSFARALASRIAEAEPARYELAMAKARRSGKILIDILRNGRGATAVAAYSTRARAIATVATPLRWDELTPKLRPESFHVRSIPTRLSRITSDPWRDFHSTRQKLTPAILRAVGARDA